MQFSNHTRNIPLTSFHEHTKKEPKKFDRDDDDDDGEDEESFFRSRRILDRMTGVYDMSFKGFVRLMKKEELRRLKADHK